MPRDGSGVFSAPAGTLATANTTILSANYNAFVNDLVADANAARPITAGGTGGDTAVEGHDGLVTKGADIASAATLNLNTATGAFVDITGATTVTAVTLSEGKNRMARAVEAFQLTASASLIVNGSTSSSYTTTAGDLLIFEGYASSVVRVWALGGSVAAATTSAAGIVELATDAEAIALTDTARAITPANLSAVLTSARWETVPNGIVSLASGSAVAAIDITGLSAYRRLRISGHLFPSTDSVSVYLRTSEDGGSSFAAGASDYDYQYIGAQSTTVAGATATAAQFPIFTTNIGNQSDEGVSFNIALGEFNQTRYAQALIETGNTRADGTLSWQALYARRRSTTARNAIRFVASSGNIYGHLIVEGLRS